MISKDFQGFRRGIDGKRRLVKLQLEDRRQGGASDDVGLALGLRDHQVGATIGH